MRIIRRAKRYWELGNPFRKRIAYIGWQGHDNLGDEMLFEAHQRLFSGYDILPFRPVSLDKVAQYKRITRRNVYRAGCLGGGTLIGRGYLDKFRRMIESCPVCFAIGTGVASSEFWKSEGLWPDEMSSWVELLGRCQFVGVRGPLSADALRDAGLADVQVVGDTALVFAKETSPADPEEKHLGINVGAPGGGQLWGDQDSMLKNVAEICKVFRSRGWKAVFLCVWPPDLENTVKVAKRAGITDPEIHEIYHNVQQALDLCQRCTVFLGEKLHATVTAICAGVPSVMIEYRPKCRDFMASIGLEEYVVRSDEIEVDRTVAMLESLAANRSSVQGDMHHRVLELKTNLKSAADRIKRIIHDSRGIDNLSAQEAGTSHGEQ